MCQPVIRYFQPAAVHFDDRIVQMNSQVLDMDQFVNVILNFFYKTVVGYILSSVLRLLSPENRLTFENLETPVRKANRTQASLSLMMEPQPPEQVPVPLECLFQCVDEQGFAKSARPGKKIVFSAFSQLINKLGFIYVGIPLLDNLPKIADPDGQFFHLPSSCGALAGFILHFCSLRCNYLKYYNNTCKP